MACVLAVKSAETRDGGEAAMKAGLMAEQMVVLMVALTVVMKAASIVDQRVATSVAKMAETMGVSTVVKWVELKAALMGGKIVGPAVETTAVESVYHLVVR